MTARRMRAGPSGRVRPCSQFLIVAAVNPNRAANRDWLEAEVLSNSQQVDRSRTIYLDAGDAESWNVLASGVGEGLVEAG